MNNISVQIDETPKEVSRIVPLSDRNQNERDPLAGEALVAPQEPLKDEQNAVLKAVNCDGNDAKDCVEQPDKEVEAIPLETVTDTEKVESENVVNNEASEVVNIEPELSEAPTVNKLETDCAEANSKEAIEVSEPIVEDKLAGVEISELAKELTKPAVDPKVIETVDLIDSQDEDEVIVFKEDEVIDVKEGTNLKEDKNDISSVNEVTCEKELKEVASDNKVETLKESGRELEEVKDKVIVEGAEPLSVEKVVKDIKEEQLDTAVVNKVIEKTTTDTEKVKPSEEKLVESKQAEIIKIENKQIAEFKGKEIVANTKNVLKRPLEGVDNIVEKKLILNKCNFPTAKPVLRSRTVSLGDDPIKPVPIRKTSTEDAPKTKTNTLTDIEENKTEILKKNQAKPMNGDIKESTTKRRASEEVEVESPFKKLCQEIEKNYPGHDNMLTEFIQNTTKNNIDEIQKHTEQLLAEIQTLRELAQKKEHEWNNILHLKKVKEELLLRLLRQKQVLSFEKSGEVNGTERMENFDILSQSKNFAIDKSDDISGVSMKQPPPMATPPLQPPAPMNTPPLPPPMNTPPLPPQMQVPVLPPSTHYSPMNVLPPPYDKAAHLHNLQNLQKSMFPNTMMMPNIPGFPRDLNGQMTANFGLPMGRQGPTKDVKSIIADYRQRNPDVTPRRGRRMKSILNPNSMMNPPPRPIAPKDMNNINMNNMNMNNMNMNNMSNLNNLGMIFNNLDMNQKAMLERLSQMQTTALPNGVSFKDVLAQYSNLQPTNPNILPCRPEMMPSPPVHHPVQIRPEVPRGNRREKPPTPHEEQLHIPIKPESRHASPSPRLPPPPPYPEISLMPVSSSSHQDQQTTVTQQNSLLHGILTKQGSPSTQSYSPTLAKLLTSPERKQSSLPCYQAKNCGEITITPVQSSAGSTPQAEPVGREPEKPEDVQINEDYSQLSDGEGSASAEGDRLVIDETGIADSIPLCQGCRRKEAQFVCAGCGSQWYCSRDCQVSAWDEHSDMCAG